ncbi:MAG: hypothetical protein JST11_28530 [Acidobacteria bacterium]|nr:hypothetical protein [Acidobacteriota bacterium]
MRQARLLLWIALAVTVIRLGWIQVTRHRNLQRLERAAGSRRGSSGLAPEPDVLRITHFYAPSGEIYSGSRGLICYGVRNARRVWMDPPVERLGPTLTRCFFVEPRADANYTLFAEDAAGARVSESLRLRVKPAPPEIRMLATSERTILRGDVMVVCYGVANARTVRLDPIGWSLPPLPKYCVRFYPKASATFSLVADGEGGVARERFPVTVR